MIEISHINCDIFFLFFFLVLLPFQIQIDNNLISSNKPGKYRQRSYDNLKTGKLNLQRSHDRRCVLKKSPHLSKIHDGRLRKMRTPMKVTDRNCIFSPSEERTFDRDERLSFIDSKSEQMPLSSSTTSTSSSLSSLSSPSHLTPSHIKLKPTLIPTQYRVYIPQKKCEMKQAYTDYVYSTDETTNQSNQIQSQIDSQESECQKQSKSSLDANAN